MGSMIEIKESQSARLQARYVATEDTELPNVAAVFTSEGIQQSR